jgi:hypothetical protein
MSCQAIKDADSDGGELMKIKLCLVTVFISIGVMAFAQAATDSEILSVPEQDIVKMTKAGIDESVLIDYIRTSRVPFGVSTAVRARLMTEGLSQTVVAEMTRRDQELGKSISTSTMSLSEDRLFRLRFGLIQYEGRLYPFRSGLSPEIKETLQADPSALPDISSFSRLQAISNATLWSGFALLLGGGLYGIMAADNGWGNEPINGGIVAGTACGGLISFLISGITGHVAYLDLYNGLGRYNRDLIAGNSGR